MLISIHKFENTSLAMELSLCICTVRPKVLCHLQDQQGNPDNTALAI